MPTAMVARRIVIQSTITSAIPCWRRGPRPRPCKRRREEIGLANAVPAAARDHAQRNHEFGPGRTVGGADAHTHRLGHPGAFLPVVAPCRVAGVVVAPEVR